MKSSINSLCLCSYTYTVVKPHIKSNVRNSRSIMLLLFYYKLYVINPINICYVVMMYAAIHKQQTFFIPRVWHYISMTRKFLSTQQINKKTNWNNYQNLIPLNYSNSIAFFFLISDIEICLVQHTYLVYSNYYFYEVYLSYDNGISE